MTGPLTDKLIPQLTALIRDQHAIIANLKRKLMPKTPAKAVKKVAAPAPAKRTYQGKGKQVSSGAKARTGKTRSYVGK